MKTALNKFFWLLCLLPAASLFGHFYAPERLAFPSLCEKHYTDPRKYTVNTWIEPVNSESLKEMAPYLKYLPRPYEADCYGCSGCGGMRLSRREEFRLPFENSKFAYDELTKLHQQVRYGTLETCRHRGSDRCESFCWDGGYFRRMNSKYFPFFKEILIYSSQNSLCKCFWHERYQQAVAINNLVYRFLYSLIEQKLIRTDFSPFWVSKEIRFDRKGRFYGKDYFPSSHGMAGSITTYTFFYSHYCQVLKDVMASIDLHATDSLQCIVARDQVYQTLEEVRTKFLALYSHCLSVHPHPKIYLERSQLYMHAGEAVHALADLVAMQELSLTEKFRDLNLFSGEAYLHLGKTYAALKMYDNASEALTQVLEREPENHEARFLRAAASFETGSFEKALEDYSLSKKGDLLAQVPYKTSAEFRDGLFRGMGQGDRERMELPTQPSALQRPFWALLILEESSVVSVDALQFFANACEEVGRGLTQGVADGLPEDALELFNSYSLLGDAEKGERLGSLIGKYGILIFSGAQKIKQVEAFRHLQEANRLCNLSVLGLSEPIRQVLIQLTNRD